MVEINNEKNFISDASEIEESIEAEIQLPKEPDFQELYPDAPTDPAELEKYLSSKVKLRWSRVLIVGFAVSIVLIGVTLLVVWIISNTNQLIWYYTTWIFFIECGLLFIFGGCIGTVKQSFTLDSVKVRIFKGEKITGADTKIALGSAYTYVLTGFFIGIASLISWLILR